MTDPIRPALTFLSLLLQSPGPVAGINRANPPKVEKKWSPGPVGLGSEKVGKVDKSGESKVLVFFWV